MAWGPQVYTQQKLPSQSFSWPPLHSNFLCGQTFSVYLFIFSRRLQQRHLGHFFKKMRSGTLNPEVDKRCEFQRQSLIMAMGICSFSAPLDIRPLTPVPKLGVRHPFQPSPFDVLAVCTEAEQGATVPASHGCALRKSERGSHWLGMPWILQFAITALTFPSASLCCMTRTMCTRYEMHPTVCNSLDVTPWHDKGKHCTLQVKRDSLKDISPSASQPCVEAKQHLLNGDCSPRTVGPPATLPDRL